MTAVDLSYPVGRFQVTAQVVYGGNEGEGING
jgi:hypothetical protein